MRFVMVVIAMFWIVLALVGGADRSGYWPLLIIGHIWLVGSILFAKADRP